MTGSFKRCVLLASCAIAGFAAPAMAQDAGNADEARDGTEVIVTAQKRNERLQDVPISVQVVAGAEIRDKGVRSFQDFSTYVPNLTVAKTPGADQITMRGTGTGSSSPTIDQSVSLFVDNVYNGHARQFAQPLFDIDNIEVLRGPQGALIGRNTSAGAVNMTTRQPGRELEGFINGGYNFTMDGPNLEGAVTVPLGEQFSVRFAGIYTDLGGYLDNPFLTERFPTRKQVGGRATLAYDTGNFTATLKAELAETNLRGTPSQITAPSIGSNLDFTNEAGNSAAGPDFDDVRNQTVALTLSGETGNVTLQSISSFSAYQSDQGLDADFLRTDYFYSVFEERYDQYAQEFRVLSDTGGSIEWAVGAYGQYSTLTEHRATVQTGFPPAGTTYRLFTQEDTTLSAYANLKFNLSEQWALVLSGRETYSRKTANFTLWRGVDVHKTRSASAPGTLIRTFPGEITNWLFDPSAKVQYTPSRNLMFYASYGRGSKAGGFQGGQPNTTADKFSFLPEKSRSFEIGSKVTFPGVGYVNIAAFDVRYSSLQVSALLPVTGTSFDVFTGNAGVAKVRGVEVDGSLRFGGVFGLAFNAAWMPTAEFDDYTNGQCYTGRVPDGTNGGCNLSGLRLALTPRISAVITPSVSVPVGDFRIGGNVALIYKGEHFTESTGDPKLIQQEFAKIDTRISFGRADGQWELAFVGRNLTNRVTSVQGSAAYASNVIAPDARQRTIDLPRTYAIQANFRF